MKVGIVAPSPVPLVIGGAHRLWDGLYAFINEHTGHDAELVKLPSPERTLPEIMASYERFTHLDVTEFDRIISTKYPAWMVDHPDHVVYVQHTLRGLYDTYHFTGLPERVDHPDPDLRDLQAFLRSTSGRGALPELFERVRRLLGYRGPDDPAFAFPGPLAREIVHYLDRAGLATSQIRRHFAISRTVARRRDYFPPGATVRALPHPTNLEGLHEGPYDYFFTASRLDGAKRLELLIAAMRHVRADVELRIAGTGPDEDRLRELAADDPRISFIGYVSSAELAELYAGALAVPFVPYDEDLGLITLEAFLCAKPVITCHDTGGPTELVVHGTSGLVTGTTPESLGGALDLLAGDRDLARTMGAAGLRIARQVTWERVASALLAEGTGPLPVTRRPDRDKVVVATTYGVHPPRGGGQLRTAEICAALADRFDVQVVSLLPADAGSVSLAVAEGVAETGVPKSPAHEQLERADSESVGWLSITDIAAARHLDRTPAFVEELERATADAVAVVVSHPYLFAAARAAAPSLPIVFDAQDVEYELKQRVLPRTPAGQRLLAVVERAEAQATRQAAIVAACSRADLDELRSRYGPPQRALHLANGVAVDAVPFVGPEMRAAARRRWLDRWPGAAALGTDSLALFLASWHPPNLDAAAIILQTALDHPRTAFLLAGSHCAYFERWRLPRNVVPLGMVSDAAKTQLLGCVDVALNPMVTGSGSNLKMLEYFAAGIPVVSTPFGARGIDAVAGVHYVEADIGRYSRTLGQVLANPTGLDDVVTAARALAEAYDWRALCRPLVDELARVLAGTAAVS
jgi:glycosyltransferase involved in cell wall biosynthesis